MNPTDAIDQQPDINSAGVLFLGDLETLGSNALATAGATLDQTIAGGRYPYDPADPNFGAIRPGQNTQASSGIGGLLLIGLVIWVVAH